MKIYRQMVFLFLVVGVVACKPDKAEIELYTTDIRAAIEGKVIEIPTAFEFKLLGDDEKGELGKARVAAMKYLSEESTIEITDGDFGKVMSLKTTMPLGIRENLDRYLQTNARLVAVMITNNKIELHPTRYLKKLNDDLKGINFMLSAELPASTTNIRIIGDDRKPLIILAGAVFVNRVAHLAFNTNVKRRTTVILEFKGGKGSIYSQLPIQIDILNP